MAAGNIKAIGDWFKSRSYGKVAIDDFFLKMSAGYLAYKFIIERGDPNEIISFVGQTSEKTYSVLLDSYGNGSALLFFEEGENVDYAMGETEDTIELTTREVTISFGYSEDYYINVYTMPTKRTYNAGDPIDISGLVIHKYSFADDTDLGEVTQYTYTPNAEYHTDIECAYDAYASEANLQLFHHNGNQRTPTRKVNSGKSIVCLLRNCGGTGYGGNWNYPICISDINDRARIYDGQSGNPASVVINGIQYYFMYVGQNPNYGGFTDQSTYYNDGNYPEVHDIEMVSPLTGFNAQKRLWLFRHLHIKYVGGAVTIKAKDENGKTMECQYGITVN